MLKINGWRYGTTTMKVFTAWDDYIMEAQDMFLYGIAVDGIAWFTEPYLALIRKLC